MPMSTIRHFRELDVYRLAMEAAIELFELSKNFPPEEKYSLTDQMRRSSRSIGAQIAEAWAKRRYEKHFISKLTDADGEQQETQHWVDSAEDCGYLEKEQAGNLNADLNEIGRMINSMIDKANQFCGQHGKTVNNR